MSNDNNIPKTASEMLFHELAANGETKRDIIDRLMLKPPLHNLSNADLVEAANEIRDLREAVNNLTAWSEGVEADNDTLRKEIARLREQRDAARRDFCNASYDDPHIVAKERGWNCFENEKKHTYFCDHCGDAVDFDNVFFYFSLPQDIASANKGESATTCRKCCEMIDANANNEHFKRNHK